MADEEAKPLIVNEWNASFHLIQTPVGLVVDVLHIKGARARIATDPFAIHVDRPGTWEAFIEEAAIQMFVENRAPDQIREIQIKLVEGSILVTAKVKVLVEIQVEATCTLRIVDNQRIYIDVETVSLGGGAGKNLVQAQLDKVNPVLDASDLPLNLKFEGVELRVGELRAYGTVEP